MQNLANNLTVLALSLAIVGCSWGPVVDAPSETTSNRSGNTSTTIKGSQSRLSLVQIAEAQIGVRYRYGGANPSQGFDCSGLVFYSHNQLGLSVPRTSQRQFQAAKPVASGDLRPGDLLFYRTDGNKVSHVGIYVGDRRFVHAPNAKGTVRYARIDDSFWTRRFAGAGRFTH